MSEQTGLKKSRAGGTWHSRMKPSYHCDNCGCDRYSPCKCMKKNGQISNPEPVKKEEELVQTK